LGGAAGTQLGWCVATLGDVNGDAIPDFLAGSGSPCTFTSSNAYIFDGLGGGILQSFPSVSTTQGQAVHAVGELAFGTGLPRYMISDPASASVLVR
jgi:hypothetical protein